MSRCLFVDDDREPPDGWDLARTYHQAIDMLTKNNYSVVSLDHDLGNANHEREYTGRDVLMWILSRHADGLPTPQCIRIHTANVSVRRGMVEDAAKYNESMRKA